MRSKLTILIMMVLLLIPFGVKAKDSEYLGNTFKTLNFKEALADEEIKESFKKYEETDDQITIYLFRGKGCSFCRAYLNFMNSIASDYGKYFKMVSFEVWNDEYNSKLMEDVSKYLGEPAEGVPYVIIGKQIFPGYASTYDEDIKKAIKDLYNTEKSERYDVFEDIYENGFGDTLQETSNESTESSTTNTYKTRGSSDNSNLGLIICSFAFTALGVIAIILFDNYKFKKLEEKINKVNLKKQTNK